MKRFSIICVCAMTLLGCSEKTEDKKPQASTGAASTPAAAASSVISRGNATVRGAVKVIGKVPEMKELKVTCTQDAKPIKEETVVVNPDNSLRNVYVYVKDVSLGEPSSTPVVLDQVNCQFVPHVIAVQVGQPVTFKNSDATLHNVHWASSINPAENFGMTQVGQTKQFSFQAAEIFHVRCDVHPWMGATIGVFDSPFFAVSGDGGAFEIKSLPKGTYTLVAQHEHYGTLEKQVEIPADDAKVEVNFEFK